MSNENMDVPLPKPMTLTMARMANWRTRKFGWATRIVVLFALFIGLILFVTNVPTHLTARDINALEGSGLDLNTLSRPLTYEDEIRVIRTVQARVFVKAPFGEGIPEYEPREPANLFKYGRGLCFDRSRTLDKALTYLGFKTRHVFLLYRQDRSLFSTLVRRGHPSHAVTEVKTSRGWLYVDSNQPWIAISRAGDPVGAGGIWKQFDQFDHAPEYVRGPWWAIRGLYSRKGAFYEPFFPLPQLNWIDFSEWTVNKIGEKFGEWITSPTPGSNVNRRESTGK